MANIRIETSNGRGEESLLMGDVVRHLAGIGHRHVTTGEPADVRLLIAVVPGDPFADAHLGVLVDQAAPADSLDLAMRFVGLCEEDRIGDDPILVRRLAGDGAQAACALRLSIPRATTAAWRDGISAGIAQAINGHLRTRRRPMTTTPHLAGRYGFRISHQAREQIDIWHEVPLVPQTTGMSCWAAAAAMVVGWRDRAFVNQEEIARGIGRWGAYREGLVPDDVETLARVWGLRLEEPRTYAGTDLADLLTRCGPLWIGQADPDLHVICVVGLTGDGTAEGTRVRVNDPWPPGRGERYSLSLGELVGNFRAAGQQVGVHAQVLHAGGRGEGDRRIERTDL